MRACAFVYVSVCVMYLHTCESVCMYSTYSVCACVCLLYVVLCVECVYVCMLCGLDVYTM